MRTSPSSQPSPILGGIYQVADTELTLLPEAERKVYAGRRPVIVLSGLATNSDSAWPLVLVAPLSTSPKWKTRFCVEIPRGMANVTDTTWVRVPAVQPLLKISLQDWNGRTVPSMKLAEIRSSLLDYQGALD